MARPHASTAAGLLALMIAGCARGEMEVAPAASVMAPAAGWRGVATEDDRRRLRDWRDAWMAALDQARTAGHGAEIEREGVLLQPDEALAGATPPPGDYACRAIKLGTHRGGTLAYVAYPAFRCRIEAEGDGFTFTKLTGSQRPIGRLYPENDRRLVFLGTLQLGDERTALRYGRDAERNMAGALERIGERRWRLILPYPHFESLLDVIELVPAG